MFFLYCNESANSMLTAVNSFLRYMEHPDCFVWQLKVPRTAYCSQDKKLKLEEYKRLVAAAEKNGFSSSFYCSKQSVIRVFRCPRPVSYTHLDVYKRQVWELPEYMYPIT